MLAFQHKEGDRVPIYEQAIASDVASKNGPLIFGISNSVLSGTPPENVIAMYETAREYGKY